MKKIYLDYAATTPIDPQVVDAMFPYLKDKFGNPSGLYTIAREVKEAIEKAREAVARLIGAKPDEIVFTSSGTEADNLALKGVAETHIITTAIEHHAVIESARFLETHGVRVSYIKPDRFGWIDPEEIEKAITDKTSLISVMHANNEIGTIESIEEISRIAKKKEIYLHTDAVQTVGHIPVDVNRLGVDLLSLSAHKFYGPKGAGALYIRKGTRISPFMHGGRQERGMRASTENVAGIVGLAKACEIARLDEGTELRDMLIKGLLEKIPGSRLNGHPLQRLPNNVNITMPNTEGEGVILRLDKLGIYASTGSACSTLDLGPSHVLLAIGLSQQEAHGSVRFTLGRNNTEEDIRYLLEILPKVISE